jgi:hypothetical protein
MTKLKKWILLNWKVPALSLGLTILCYLLLSPALRFYLDDWPQLYSLLIRGSEGIKQYFLFDGRPFGYWPDLFFFRLWGTNPFLWHITNSLLRWLTAMFMWGTFKQIWPDHQREVGWVVILFTVYPLFGQQSMGLTFIAHWMCYLLFFISLCLMVAAVRSKKYAIPLLLLSLLVNVPNLFTYENFIGVEFTRPLLLWIALSEERIIKQKLSRVILYWLPFLALASFYIVWRVFLFENLRASNTPILFSNLVHNTFPTLIQLFNFILRDTLQVILGVWLPTIDPGIIDVGTVIKIFAIILSGIVIFVLVRLLQKNNLDGNNVTTSLKDHFPIQAIVVGLIGVLLGCAPGWLIMRTVSGSYGLWDDRFGLPAMFGASLFIVGILGVLIKRNRYAREIFLAVLIGLAVGRNFSVTNEYRLSSVQQNQFFSQLKWRAPYIKSRTSILADNEMFTKMGEYPTSFALNLLYPSVELMPRTDYWFFTLHKQFPDQLSELSKGFKVDAVKWYIYYEAESQNSLVVSWHFDQPGCVWVLTGNDRFNPLISANTAAALGASNLSRINPNGLEGLPSVDLFGREDQNTWCYYYEKADLARQLNAWKEVTRLYVETQTKGYLPSNGVELMPFIEAYARIGDAEKSMQLTKTAITLTDNLTPYLCDNWNRFAPELSGDAKLQSLYQTIYADYSCSTVVN